MEQADLYDDIKLFNNEVRYDLKEAQHKLETKGLTKEQLKSVVDFARTSLWKTYLEYTEKVKDAADLTSAEFVDGFKAGLKDVKVTNAQQRTSVANYVSLSRSFPEYLPEFQRPYAEMTVSAGKYEDKNIDLLILNGDIPDHCGTPENMMTVYMLVSELTRGKIPTVFSRGNHDMRGLCAEKFAGTVDGNLFYHIHVLASAIVTVRGITFRIFIG